MEWHVKQMLWHKNALYSIAPQSILQTCPASTTLTVTDTSINSLILNRLNVGDPDHEVNIDSTYIGKITISTAPTCTFTNIYLSDSSGAAHAFTRLSITLGNPIDTTKLVINKP